MNMLTWFLTVLPGLGVIIGMLKWFVRAEMRPHTARIDLLMSQIRQVYRRQRSTDEKIDLLTTIVRDKL